MVMTSVVREMAKRFPDVTVEIFADDAIVNIVEDGFDAGIRLGEMIAEDMITARLTPRLWGFLQIWRKRQRDGQRVAALLSGPNEAGPEADEQSGEQAERDHGAGLDEVEGGGVSDREEKPAPG